jgi:2-polyprenyl-3-methyl-5-hydroxy-6-metoxy-1,4-benzoquinol methylase
MFGHRTDKEWGKFGKRDAYYGVYAQEKYRHANLTPEGKKEFFESGADHIGEVLENIARHLDPTFKITKALDFGCGVGRLTIPLADSATSVTGADVSESMLREARHNCDLRSIDNVVFVKSDDNLSELSGTYDLIHSYLVFQHIPVARGEQLFKKLLARLEAGGVCVAHFTYASTRRTKRLMRVVHKYVPFSGMAFNLIRGKAPSAPLMQMNAYGLNRVFRLIQDAQPLNCFVHFTRHDGELGVVIYFQKGKSA